MARLIFAVVVGATLALAAPALAQFGSIFSDPPPRPPGNVPQRGAAPPPPRNFPTNRNAPPQQEPMDDQDDEADDQPPPQALPRGGQPPQAQQQQPAGIRRSIEGVQSQPLAPPPGAPAVPLDATAPAAPAAAPSAQQAAPAQTLPPGQRQPRGAPPQPANTAPQPGDEIVVQPPEQKIANPTAVFSGLDKITGRTISFDVAINETVQFGALQVTPRACYSRPPTETPNTDAFVAIDEVTLQGEVRRIFTGWMFAASPGLHAVEHPVYDVWLTDCKGGAPAVAEVPPEQPAAKPAAQKPSPSKPTQPPPQQRRTQQQAPNFLSPFR
ncbi:MAG: DUF2155 domain-containing protein [Pseudolabrys sp.]|nr:DUF2155 domain-containing protein [Pseudolabrys sp.]